MCCNQISNKDVGSVFKIIGIEKDNVLVEMYVKKLFDGSFRIKSAYPYYKEFSWIKL